MKNTWQVLTYPNGDLVGLDRDSGGYPYRAAHPSQIKFFASMQEAEDYRSHFPKEGFALQILTLDWVRP